MTHNRENITTRNFSSKQAERRPLYCRTCHMSKKTIQQPNDHRLIGKKIKIIARRSKAYIQMVMQHNQVGFIPEMQWWFNMCKSAYRTYNKNHIITQWMQEKVFEKSTWLHDKSVKECINQGNLLHYNKNCMQEIHSQNHPKWKK